MIVVAPVIWTTGVAFLTPLFTEMLARRYDFDLVPYYPLVLTAFLLLTSIIIVGGLGAFLVLDEVDAGTLTALRVTPVPLRDFFAYRAATVIVVTTVYVIATTSLSGLLAPGMSSGVDPDRVAFGPVGGRVPAADRRSGQQQDPGPGNGAGTRHADRRAAVPAVVHRFRVEPRVRCVAAVLGGQGILGRERPRQLVAVRDCGVDLQPAGRLAFVPTLPGQERS